MGDQGTKKKEGPSSVLTVIRPLNTITGPFTVLSVVALLKAIERHILLRVSHLDKKTKKAVSFLSVSLVPVVEPF